MMTFGLPTWNSNPSRRIVSISTEIWSSPRPATSNESGEAVSFTLKDTFLSSSLNNLSLICLDVTNSPSLPANGPLLTENVIVTVGSSAKGIDLPSEDILTDIKVTSIKQPQSSCPFRDAKQKIFGLGYNLLVFVYDKTDDPATQTAILNFVSCSFVSKERTADYTTTSILNDMKKVEANEDDIVAFLEGIKLPADEITLQQIAGIILATEIPIGYLTISNALQWRLQYKRIVNLSDDVPGVEKIVSYNKPK